MRRGKGREGRARKRKGERGREEGDGWINPKPAATGLSEHIKQYKFA